jgi:CRISPR-associated protein Cas1
MKRTAWQDDPPLDVLFAMDALRRAFQQVRRNGPSPGTDGKSLKAFEANLESELQSLRDQICGGSYRPFPVKRYYKRKPSGKNRPISIWAIRDRVAQRVVLDYLTPHLEKIFLDCSYGFRPGRSVEDAVQSIMEARQNNLRWVLDADIENCFDSIPTDLLLQQLQSLLPSQAVIALIRMWLHTKVARHNGEVAGVSQGSVISPQLANLYLHRFDEMIIAALPGSQLVRFADDFVILSRRKKDALWSMSVSRRCLQNLKLRMNAEKSQVVHFEEGFSFLGVTFQGRNVLKSEQ